jgi:WD40 repeat protein
LSGIDYAEFTEQVARQDVRPKRPDDKVAPQLSDTAWELAKRCWVKEPECRPIATVVYDALTYILSSTTTQPALIPSHTPVIVPPPSTPPPHAPVEPYPHRSFSPPPNLIWRYTSLVYGAAFSPDGKYIVSGSRDCKIIVWDAQTGKPILRPPKKHDDFVSCVTFSPDGRRIASGSWDRTILVWDSLTGKVVTRPFKGHNHVIGCISFSHDGKWIASGSWDKTIRVWDAQRGILLVGPLKAHADNVSSVAFSVDGTLLVSGSGSKKIRVWDARSGQLIRKVKGHADTRFVAFSLDGERIVSAHSQGNVCVWNTDTGGLISGPSKRHAEGTLAAVFASNSTLLCAVSPDGNLMAAKDGDVSKVWDLKTGRCVATFSDSTKDVWSFAFSPDNKRILTTSDDTICVRTINMLPMTREHTNQDDGQSCIIH